MSQIADNFDSCPTSFKEYMDNLLDKQLIKQQARTKRKNDAASKKIALQTKQLSSNEITKTISTNFIQFKPGTLRLIKIKIKNHILFALIDTGATSSIINKNIANKFNMLLK